MISEKQHNINKENFNKKGKNMTKKDFINRIKELSDAKLTITEATTILEIVTKAIINTLKDGEIVAIPGLGKFATKERVARKGRNPATGETIDIPAKIVVTFKASKGIIDD